MKKIRQFIQYTCHILTIIKLIFHYAPQKLNQDSDRQSESSTYQSVKGLSNISCHDVILLSSKVGMRLSFIPNIG